MSGKSALELRNEEHLRELTKLTPDSLQKFNTSINGSPDSKHVKSNKHANNSKYLPISHIEMMLDKYFFGLWETFDFRWEQIANEVVGHICIKVFHPSARMWITRTGTAAVQIRQKSGTEILDIGAHKIKNALVTDFPHLEAECIKSAAKKLGKLFGRDLNRDFEDSYQPFNIGLDSKIVEKIESFKDSDGLAEYAMSSEYSENKEFESMVKKQMDKINGNRQGV